MLKLVKYEFLKSRFILLIAAIIFAMLEGWFILSYYFGNVETMAKPVAFLILATIAAFFMVFIMGITAYGNELKSKQGYMVFMTPNSSLKIILSKLIFVFFLGAVVAGVIGTIAVLDIRILANEINQRFPFFQIIDVIKAALNVDLLGGLTLIGLKILAGIISFYAIVVMAYLAITFAATVLQNNKGRAILSFILFILLVVVLTNVEAVLRVTFEVDVDSFVDAVAYIMPGFVFDSIVSVLGIAGTTYLLDKKISL